MSVVVGTRLASPVGHVPKAHRSDGMGTLGPSTASRTVNVEWAVSVSAVSYERKLGLPSRVSVKVPACGMVRSEYSMRRAATIGVPSAFVATGKSGKSRLSPGATSPCQPASTMA